QAGHLVLGQTQLVTAGLGQAQVTNLVVKRHRRTLPVHWSSVSCSVAHLGTSRVITHASSEPQRSRPRDGPRRAAAGHALGGDVVGRRPGQPIKEGYTAGTSGKGAPWPVSRHNMQEL